ncbi:MAG: 2-oxoacid:acceptor oxidoreductase subunit alpha [Thermoplasmataceae archaeon]
MAGDEVKVRIAGAAGDGVQSAGLIMARVFSRSGLHVSTYNYYQSIIRGGQSWYQIRVASEKVKNQGDGLDILVALNKDGVERHTNPQINEGGASVLNGIAIFDKTLSGFKEYPDTVKYCPVPLSDIGQKYSKNPLLKNTVALGMVCGYLSVDFEVLANVIREQFGGKGDIVEQNVKAAKEGYDFFVNTYGKSSKKLDYQKKVRYLMAGGDASGLGAVRGGLKAFFGYPMTPASSFLHFLAQHSKSLDVFVKVTEDEISAINMAIGANYAGVRAMTGTSGGGFALMTEAVGMSGMMEVPLVVYEAQRAGPSTGLPTKTEQGDLLQVLGASQGDFPKVILAPRNVEEAYYMMSDALNIADEYQLPVLYLTDLYLTEHHETIDQLNPDFEIKRGKMAKDGMQDYKRYEFTSDGISFRALPGQPEMMHNEDSDEHNEKGDVVSDAITDPYIRKLAMEKRMKKLNEYIKTIPPTPTYKIDDAESVIIQWGSTQGAVEESIDILRKKGFKVGAVEITHLYPMNGDIKQIVKGKKHVIFVENNYTGQLRRLVMSEFGIIGELIVKYDGESFYPGKLSEEIEEILKR